MILSGNFTFMFTTNLIKMHLYLWMQNKDSRAKFDSCKYFHQPVELFFLNAREGVLVFQGCCIKMSKTGRLKTTEISSLLVLEARSLKSRCWQGRALSDDSRGESLLISSNFCYLSVQGPRTGCPKWATVAY